MKNKRYFLSRVSSTEEYDGIYFCYIEVENPEMFSADLRRMNMAFVQSQLIFPTVSVDFAEPGAVRTFYLGSDDEDILENLFEGNSTSGDKQGFVELENFLSADFLEENTGQARIDEFRIRFVGEFQAVFIGRYKHFSGEVETGFISRDLMTGDNSKVISGGKNKIKENENTLV